MRKKRLGKFPDMAEGIPMHDVYRRALGALRRDRVSQRIGEKLFVLRLRGEQCYNRGSFPDFPKLRHTGLLQKTSRYFLWQGSFVAY
jgi:hypothetical protein